MDNREKLDIKALKCFPFILLFLFNNVLHKSKMNINNCSYIYTECNIS